MQGVNEVLNKFQICFSIVSQQIPEKRLKENYAKSGRKKLGLTSPDLDSFLSRLQAHHFEVEDELVVEVAEHRPRGGQDPRVGGVGAPLEAYVFSYFHFVSNCWLIFGKL